MAANFEVYRGDCLPISLACKQSDGTVFDLTGYSVAVRAKWGENNDDYVDLPSPTNGESLGTITGTFTASNVDEMPEGKTTRLHLRLTQPSGCIKTIFLGRVRVRT